MGISGCVKLHACAACEKQTDCLHGWVWALGGWLCPACVQRMVRA